ncbi:response regulator [uncultured Draconibacterium sp.]|uniref:hybrid sensor histidine kinase/response regulator n=1 Tax=uncultured Draconibacterium sp. TaxID=1573823 RepID=UPI0029C0797B|nr:response regulator [uncultured Draconibacterium sp.]
MKNSKIFIVDDNEKNIQVLANTLSDLYEIEYTTDGYDAISWIKAEKFDLILLDVMMPKINGFQVCEAIRKEKSFNDIPIIFLTAKTDIESIVNGFRVGGQDYITKPFNDEELKARVKTHLELKKSKEKLTNVNKWLQIEVDLKTKELSEAYNELKQLDTAKSEFLNLVSHELRTPLNGIIGFTDILKSLIDSEDLLEYIDLLEFSSNRLLRFAHTATLITSLRAKKYKFSPEKLNVVSIISEAEAFSSEIFKNKSIRLEFKKLTSKTDIIADHNLLLDGFKCIIENALNYSPANSIIEITINNDYENLIVSIEDHGPGFSEQALHNIFKPFGYGQQHIDQNIGLSLYLVKLILDAHQSKISAENSDQGGAIVTMYFPTK